MVYKKAKEIVQSGAIGHITADQRLVGPQFGAWRLDYTVAPDASDQTIDWPRLLGTAPKIPFNPEHFFQWRKWKAYGTGVAGDLFVHFSAACTCH